MYCVIVISSPTIESFFRESWHLNEGAIAVNQEQEATGPGIVVMSPSLQVLHMNRRAMALLNQLEYTHRASERSGLSPLRCTSTVGTSLIHCRHAWDRTTGNNSSNAA